MTTTERKFLLVDYLEDLAEREDGAARATLATLRASLQASRAMEGLHLVIPFVSPNSKRRRQDEDDALLLAGLFALHPERGSLSLAAALSLLASKSESIELRFRALLSAGRSDLPTHLRHAVALVASHHYALDWRDMHDTIRWWEHEDHHARRRWARDFWTIDHTDEGAETAATTEGNPQ